jgi:hypothetical protein
MRSSRSRIEVLHVSLAQIDLDPLVEQRHRLSIEIVIEKERHFTSADVELHDVSALRLAKEPEGCCEVNPEHGRKSPSQRRVEVQGVAGLQESDTLAGSFHACCVDNVWLADREEQALGLFFCHVERPTECLNVSPDRLGLGPEGSPALEDVEGEVDEEIASALGTRCFERLSAAGLNEVTQRITRRPYRTKFVEPIEIIVFRNTA